MSQPRPPTPSRGPGIADLLWLVAATAAAMGFYPVFLGWHGPQFNTPGKVILDMKQRGPVWFPIHVTFWVQLASIFLLAWTLALVPIRLRRPRPPFHRLLRQPGAVAVLATVAAVVASLACWGLLALPTLFGSRIFVDSMVSQFYPIPFRAFNFLLTAVGHSVLAAWSVLALSRRWRPERSWIDRSGRALGVGWIVLLPANHWSAFITL